MKFFQNRRSLLIIWLCGIMLLGLSFISDLIVDKGYEPAKIKVEIKDQKKRYPENDTLQPIISAFSPTVTVKGEPYVIVKNNFVLSFLAPADMVEDPISAFCLIVLAIIFLVRVRKLDLDKPFSPQMLIGIKWAGICSLLFGVFDYLRLILINNQIKDLTGNTYHLEHFTLFNSTFFWGGIFLSWLYRILRKAEVLQTEQELTV